MLLYTVIGSDCFYLSSKVPTAMYLVLDASIILMWAWYLCLPEMAAYAVLLLRTYVLPSK